MHFGTKAIHAGQEPDQATNAVMTPIYQTSTYSQASPGDHKGYEYSRTQNPTRHALEKNLAALENGKHGLCFGSGMAATDTLMRLFKPGDEIIATNDLYGGTYRLFSKVYAPLGIKSHFCPLQDLDAVEALINENTKMLWVETPTNPTMKIYDIEGLSAIAKKHNILLAVDNTFASPYLQQPLNLGADIVMHSVTKYLGGHSDVVMGALICKDDKLAEDLYFLQNSCGGVCGPQDSFLVLRGIKTLHLRMQRHCENGLEVVNFLKSRKEVRNIYHPSLNTHPNHEIAKKQMKGFGGMVSFDFHDDTIEKAFKFASSTDVFTLAESLGGVESLIGHPASMTHAAIPKEEREKTGVSDSLIRLSVGVEDVRDILTDLEQAFSKL